MSMPELKYELDDVDRALIDKVRVAILYEDDGGVGRDAIDEDEMFDGLRLLLTLIDAGYAS